MLSEANVQATIAVSDIQKGKEFYGQTLGLTEEDENPGGVTYSCAGGGKLFVYASDTAGSGKATCAAFELGDVEACVDELKAQGVEFEQYDDMPDTKREGDIHIMGPFKTAWFKDPDGNILAIASMA